MEDISNSTDTHEVLLSVESEYLSSEEEPPATLREGLASSSVKSGCSRYTLHNLLSILKNYRMNELPNDSRIFLQTPRPILTESRCGGSYSYIGIIEGIKSFLEICPFLSKQEVLDLIILT